MKTFHSGVWTRCNRPSQTGYCHVLHPDREWSLPNPSLLLSLLRSKWCQFQAIKRLYKYLWAPHSSSFTHIYPSNFNCLKGFKYVPVSTGKEKLCKSKTNIFIWIFLLFIIFYLFLMYITERIQKIVIMWAQKGIRPQISLLHRLVRRILVYRSFCSLPAETFFSQTSQFQNLWI